MKINTDDDAEEQVDVKSSEKLVFVSFRMTLQIVNWCSINE